MECSVWRRQEVVQVVRVVDAGYEGVGQKFLA